MNSDTFKFDSHFAVAVNNEIHPVKIWNRELLIPQDELPNPLNKEMKTSQFFQLSIGWIIVRYISCPDDGVNFTFSIICCLPGSKKAPKKLKPKGYINSVLEFSNGDILIFTKEKAFKDSIPYYIFVYTSSFSFIKKVEVPYAYSALALNSQTLIIATMNRLNLYTYPEFEKKQEVNRPGLLHIIRDLKRITDSLFISCGDQHIELWNENLEVLKIFKFDKSESIRNIYILPPLMENTRILALSWNLVEEKIKAGITIFPLDKFPSVVNMNVTLRIPSIIGGNANSTIYIKETQEILVSTENGITSTSLKTFETKKLMDIPAKFAELISVKWPPSKEEFESVVNKVKKLIPIPVDLIREMIEFLKF